jgi:hypothetical protein
VTTNDFGLLFVFHLCNIGVLLPCIDRFPFVSISQDLNGSTRKCVESSYAVKKEVEMVPFLSLASFWAKPG